MTSEAVKIHDTQYNEIKTIIIDFLEKLTVEFDEIEIIENEWVKWNKENPQDENLTNFAHPTAERIKQTLIEKLEERSKELIKQADKTTNVQAKIELGTKWAENERAIQTIKDS